MFVFRTHRKLRRSRAIKSSMRTSQYVPDTVSWQKDTIFSRYAKRQYIHAMLWSALYFCMDEHVLKSYCLQRACRQRSKPWRPLLSSRKRRWRPGMEIPSPRWVDADLPCVLDLLSDVLFLVFVLVFVLIFSSKSWLSLFQLLSWPLLNGGHSKKQCRAGNDLWQDRLPHHARCAYTS